MTLRRKRHGRDVLLQTEMTPRYLPIFANCRNQRRAVYDTPMLSSRLISSPSKMHSVPRALRALRLLTCVAEEHPEGSVQNSHACYDSLRLARCLGLMSLPQSNELRLAGALRVTAQEELQENEQQKSVPRFRQ